MREALAPAALALAGLLSSCGLQTSGLANDGRDGGGPGDADAASDTLGLDLGDSVADGDDTRPVESDDAIPAGAISYFKRSACPKGWEPYGEAAGRTILPTIGTSMPGVTHGSPLASGEDRTHTHTVTLTFTLGTFSLLGAGGGRNVAASGSYKTTATTAPASARIPTLQLLVCKKTGKVVAHAKPLPRGMQQFFDGTSCPAGWSQSVSSQGRLLVALPKGGAPDKTFGGEPMSAAAPRAHLHPAKATLKTSSKGFLLASGGGSADGLDGTYTCTTDTTSDVASPPFVELLSCTKD